MTAQRPQRRTTDPVRAGLIAGFQIKRRLHLDEWAEENIVLSAERASAPGPFRIGNATYQRGMMRAITNPENEVICFLTSSQVGKTSVLNAAQGYYAHQEPAPQLSVFPNNLVADAYLETQFRPTIRDSDTLRPLFDTKLSYPGGYIAFVGANTPAQLAMRPIRVLTGDEIDRWPLSSGKEGTPRLIAEKRLTTYKGSRKAIYASTPLHTKTSEITTIFNSCRQHYFHVVCPSCGHNQILTWDNVVYAKGREADAHYMCAGDGCGELWTELQKRRLVRDAEDMGGGWTTLDEAPFKAFRQTATPVAGRVGFWICELYSPWSSLAEMAQAWSAAEVKPEEEQAFFNTRLGLPWDGDVSSFADAEVLRQRRETYNPKIVPSMAGLVTAAVDVQQDRLEILTVAWGIGDECWLLEKLLIHANPTIKTTWLTLSEVLSRRYPHAAGNLPGGLPIEAVAIDSGYATQEVYEFSGRAQKVGRAWHAIKGMPGERRPMWLRSDTRNKINCHLFLVGVDDGKSTVYSRYGIPSPGPGYVHLHVGITDDMIDQMTAEHCETTYPNGYPKREWEKKTGRRNEMLDLMVYNLAVRSAVPIDMMTRLRRLHQKEDKNAVNAAAVGAMFR